ncbi:MAG: GNAT family N-acetyltransferase [Clostridiales bacterium]|nr:GNAT family N-acetyltransferase [Clostridiales bacterium]
MDWHLKSFEELSAPELHDILKLRCEVFVVEQNCAYADVDGLDRVSLHLFCTEDGVLVGCLRILPAGVAFERPGLGRFVVDPVRRGGGLGRTLLRRGMQEAFDRFGCDGLELSGQTYLQRFYEAEGFVPTGEPYLEDGIEHVDMLCRRGDQRAL